MRSRTAALLAIVAGLAFVLWMGTAWNRARRLEPRELEILPDPRAAGGESESGAAALPPLAIPKADGANFSAQRAELAQDGAQTRGVRAVIEDGNRPAAGADVYWFGGEQLEAGRWRDDLDESGMGVDFFERNGRHFVCDADGTARVPAGAGRIQIVAVTPTHFGMTTIDRPLGSDEPIALSLRPAFAVEVRVLGSRSHAPVRDVVVVASCPQLPQSRVGARTDERGIARLFPLFHEADPRGTWSAYLPGVFFDEIRAALPMEVRSEPLELLLPDSAPAVVRIVDKGGALCPLTGKLTIGWNDREGDAVEPREVRIHGGMANLTRIESGLNLHVRATLQGSEETPTAVFTRENASAAPVRFDLVLERRPKPARD